jgi:probable addiction module antidote protein
MTEKLRDFDAARYLDSEETIALYLDAAIEEDPSMLTHALGTVARARGMSELSQKTGLAREALYRALSDSGNPRLDTLTRVLKAYGVRIRFDVTTTT